MATGSSSTQPVSQQWSEEPPPDKVTRLRFSDLVRDTNLSTDSGERVSPARFVPRDRAGAKFYFPRILPDGSALISKAHKELRFETRIGDQRLKVRFDLRKMVYKGRLEL